MARARVGFRWSLACYVIVNAMLVVIWFFSSGAGSYFWPVWPMMGWGLGLAFQYFHAYHGTKFSSAVSEYEKLREREYRKNPEQTNK
ncbi:2TM domain-containing protein [Sediminibacterium sp. WSJ-3]|nr:2TM domain-containing protein [Sediminibacterium soli]